MREKNVAKESKRERQPRGESKLKKRKVPLHDKVEHSCRERKKKKKNNCREYEKRKKQEKMACLVCQVKLIK